MDFNETSRVFIVFIVSFLMSFHRFEEVNEFCDIQKLVSISIRCVEQLFDFISTHFNMFIMFVVSFFIMFVVSFFIMFVMSFFFMFVMSFFFMMFEFDPKVTFTLCLS